MKKICNTCTYWTRYRRIDDKCYCEITSGGNYSEVYTSSGFACKGWKKWENNFKKFRDSIKPKLTIG